MGLRVLVAGAGAVGSVVGGLLAAAGHRVTLLGRTRAPPSDRRGGPRDRRPLGRTSDPRARARDERRGGRRTVRRRAPDASRRSIRRRCWRRSRDPSRPDGCVIALQNGLGNVEQVVLPPVGAERALGGRVIFGAADPAARRGAASPSSRDPIARSARRSRERRPPSARREWTRAFRARRRSDRAHAVACRPTSGRRSSTMRR